MASYVYKKFTNQDYRTTSFNAHKQYNFNSASAASNSVSIYNTRWTSESVSVHSSASSNPEGIFDRINTIKYNQLDFLFYKDYKSNFINLRDFIDPKKQRRELYEKANIISIPSGLYGSEIKKSSFYLSSSTYEVVDDSYGNLIISGTNLNDYPTDVDENVFQLGPVKGFKKYDLSIYDGYAKTTYYHLPGVESIPAFGHTTPVHMGVLNEYWRQGQINPAASQSYTSPTSYQTGKWIDRDGDDSYFNNFISYEKVTFSTSSLGSNSSNFSSIVFNSYSQSYISSPNSTKYNFNSDEDFAKNNISNLEKRYIIAKSGTKTVFPNVDHLPVGMVATASLAEEGPQYPFEIFMISQSLYFSRSDGDQIIVVDAEITSSDSVQKTSHVLCQSSASKLELYIDGIKKVSQTYYLSGSTKNNANLYIGSKGPLNTSVDSGSRDLGIGSAPIGDGFNVEYFSTNYDMWRYDQRNKHFNGELSNINIWNRPFTATQVENISESINGSPYIGNIFYRMGFATITHPKYNKIARGEGSYIGNMEIGDSQFYNPFIVGGGIDDGINTIQFQGTHLIHEHEYVCHIQEHEYNHTTNITTRKTREGSPYDMADFTTSSFFQPHITTIGLYNEAHELLVTAKLGQPIRVPENTDLTFVLRWDT
jgi:hypothetical protein